MMTRRYKYLGKKVRDVGRRGLDRPVEYRRIKDEIVRDYRAGRISAKTAQGRLLLLYRLVDKNSKLRASASTKRRLKSEIRAAMREVRGGRRGRRRGRRGRRRRRRR